MKFAHISDTHLGFSQFGTGERAKDVYDAFLQAIDISIKEKVEFVVFAGFSVRLDMLITFMRPSRIRLTGSIWLGSSTSE